MNLYYIANIRIPTEKAHGLQIMQNCEAFASQGAQVTLVTPTRVNTAEMNAIRDVWTYYGVTHSFALEKVMSLDLLPLGGWFERIAFPLQLLTFVIMVVFRFGRNTNPNAMYYSRDILVLLALSWLKPPHTLAYEAHQLSKSRIGMHLQSWCVRRVGITIAVTGKLAEQLQQRRARRVIVAHDGFRPERFANLSPRAAARQQLGLPAEVFIAGYVGQLHTMSMSKGIDALVDACAEIADQPIYICLVGGPSTMLDQLRRQWQQRGLPNERFLGIGRVAPSQVPLYIRAFDVCTMTFPWTEHFAYYASPLKLFEYMAVGGTILASDLPSIAEVVTNEQSALLVPPSDVSAIAAALVRLREDPALREQLGQAAYQQAAHYSWQARAAYILKAMQEAR